MENRFAWPTLCPQARQGRTTVVVAHRLSTIQNADMIYVLQEGEMMESGSHAQLMEQGGLYHQLVTLQQIANEEGVDVDTSGNNECLSK